MAFKLKEQHWNIMIDFFEKNRGLATGLFVGPNGRIEQKRLWMELAQNLNCLGLGERTPDKWNKCWTDYKYLLKKKAAALNRDHIATGGGSSEVVPLNDLELRVLALLGPTFYKGVGSKEIGVKSVSNNKKILFRAESEEPSTPCTLVKAPVENHTATLTDHNYGFTPNKNKKRKISNVDEVEIYQETLDVLKDIKNTMQEGLSNITYQLDRLATAIEKSNN